MPTPLQGATFELRALDDTTLLTATSNASGVVTLGTISPGSYKLVETVVPAGYIGAGPFNVDVDEDGDITVNGQDITAFQPTNTPYPNMTFAKTDNADAPLANGVFEMRNEGGQVQTSTSDISGNVVFYGLAPGSYTLIETTPPFGYLIDDTIYHVTVANDGTITIADHDYASFKVVNSDGYTMTFTKYGQDAVSDAPAINPITASDTDITGTGINGSTITVTWPNAEQSTGTVTTSNIWSIEVPATVTLAQNDAVKATQQTGNMTASEETSVTVA